MSRIAAIGSSPRKPQHQAVVGDETGKVPTAASSSGKRRSSARSTGPNAQADRNHRAKGPDNFQEMKRLMPERERRSADSHPNADQRATVIRFGSSPLSRLADKKSIETEEVRAARDISVAFHAQAYELKIKSPCLEKRDPSYPGYEPAYTIDAISRYKRWARLWSSRARDGDRTLEIVIAAVIDERAFHLIEQDVGIRHGVAAKVVIAALRDYAARAGWTDHKTADLWIEAAQTAYPRRRKPSPRLDP